MTTFSEALKAISDLPKPIVDTGVALINSLLGKPFHETGELISDQIYAWRWANRIRIAEKAAKRLAETEMEAKVLPPGFLIPLLDTCGNVDDESMQDMWASLLTEGVRDESSQQATYRKTLEALTPGDAKWIMSLRRDELSNPGQRIKTGILPRRGMENGARGGSAEMNGRLLVLGLLTPLITRELQSELDRPDYRGPGYALYDHELSDYARQFLAMVGGGEFPWPSSDYKGTTVTITGGTKNDPA
jgi:hypothetical protein